MSDFTEVISQLAAGKLQRILAFGSSNTERRLEGMHWFDCLDLALKKTHGRFHRCINTGIGGHTAAQLLERFDEDAAFYKPHAVFITVGGNDANPPRNQTHQLFRHNLLELHHKFTCMGTAVVFQTYYAPNVYQDGLTSFLIRFYEFMEIVRQVAKETGSELIDHLARWEPFRVQYREQYLQLMEDVMHLNTQGNLVFGLDLARHFHLNLFPEDQPFWSFTHECQKLMDASVTKSTSEAAREA